MSETTAIQNRLIEYLCRTFKGARFFRRNVGTGYGTQAVQAALKLSNPAAGIRALQGMYPIKFGIPGEPDIDGWIPVRGLAVRAGVELKMGRDRQNEDQQRWERVITEAGGIYVLAEYKTGQDVDAFLEGVRLQITSRIIDLTPVTPREF